MRSIVVLLMLRFQSFWSRERPHGKPVYRVPPNFDGNCYTAEMYSVRVRFDGFEGFPEGTRNSAACAYMNLRQTRVRA